METKFSESFINELYEMIEEGERQCRADRPGVAPNWLHEARELYRKIEESPK